MYGGRLHDILNLMEICFGSFISFERTLKGINVEIRIGLVIYWLKAFENYGFSVPRKISDGNFNENYIDLTT